MADRKRPEAGAPTLTQLADVRPESIAWAWPQRLARGKFTLVAGDPGLGKSRLLFDIAARVTTGAAWPDGSGRAPRGSVLLMLAEDGLADTVRPAIDAMGGDPRAVFVLNVTDASGTRPVDLARDLRALDAAIEDTKPELVGIDPITAFLGRTDSYKDAEVRALLAPLLAVVEQHHAALLGIAHLAKNAQRAALYRPGGSIAFVAAARLAFAVAADPDDEERRILAPLKANICQPAPSLAFRLPEGRVQWEADSVSFSAEALLAPRAPTRNHDALDQASAFLRELLANGPTPSDTVFKEARQLRISADTLRRAQKELGIKPRKRGIAGGWVWQLPETTAEDAEALSHRNVIPIFEDTHHNMPIFEDGEDAEDTHLLQAAMKRIPS